MQMYGGMPLLTASQRGHVECVLLLLDRGAGVDEPDVSRVPRFLVVGGRESGCWHG